jgi:hypothetical protein
MSPPKLLDQPREAARLRHLSLRTEQAYVGWIRRHVLFHGKRHPREMGAEEIGGFPSDLAVHRRLRFHPAAGLLRLRTVLSEKKRPDTGSASGHSRITQTRGLPAI